MKNIFGAIIIFLIGMLPVHSQVLFQAEKPGPNAIVDKLLGINPKAFRMGWLLPDGKLLLDDQSDSVFVYSDGAKVLSAKFVKALDKEELGKIRAQYCMPCGESAGNPNPFYEYQVDGNAGTSAERVLVSTVPVPDASMGFKQAYRTKFLLKKAAGILGIKKGQLHKYKYMQTLDGKFVYSFHAFYDPKTKELKRSGVMLEKRGVLLVADAQDFDLKENGESSKIPTFAESLDSVFAPINLLETSSLVCPIVIMEMGTPEGKGITLLTYDLDGVKSEVRAFENTANCCK